MRSTSLHTDASGAASPDAFGPFRVLHQIGAGALGPVFRACEPETDRAVAVKLFRLDLPPERAHLLAGEFDRLIAAGLAHPSIAAPLATGITVTSAYLVQEFVEGESLDVAMRARSATSIADALRIADQVAAALDHAAAAEVTHGALHPRDILMSGEETRITGLGVAKALERAGAVAPVRRPYAPPERAAGVGWDHRSDVFSLAALVYEMLWARRVTASGEPVTRAMTDLPGTDPGALRRVFGRALASDPADRFESAGAFADALRAGCSVGAAAWPEPLPFVRRERRARTPVVRAEESSARGDAAIEPLLPLDPPIEPPNESAPGDDLVPVRTGDDFAPPPSLPHPRRNRGGAAAPVTPSASAFVVSTQPDTLLSGLVPLALTGIVFLAVGFATGYGVASWQSPGEAPAAVVAPAVAPDSPAPVEPVVAAEPPPPPVPPPVRGQLVVRSTPAGARVFVDGRARGRTPLTLASLDAGTYLVRVTLDGHAPVERRLAIDRSRPSQSLSLTLAASRPAAAPVARPATASGSMQVESRPAGATVYLDGRLVGRTPMQLDDIRAGAHTVALELTGYRRWTSSVEVGAGERRRVAASLEQN